MNRQQVFQEFSELAELDGIKAEKYRGLCDNAVYELEEMLLGKHFLRVSKSTLLNLMKVSAIKPALNSRFTAVLFSGEQVVITRKYVPELKKALKGDAK